MTADPTARGDDNESKLRAARVEFARLTTPDVIGFYTNFELTEIFAYRKGETPINIFSILVGDERSEIGDTPPALLGERMRLKSHRQWTFGIQRTVLSSTNTACVVASPSIEECKRWRPSGARKRVRTVACGLAMVFLGS